MSHTVSPQEADCLWGFLCSWGAVTEGAETQAAARCAVRLCRANGEMGGAALPKGPLYSSGAVTPCTGFLGENRARIPRTGEKYRPVPDTSPGEKGDESYCQLAGFTHTYIVSEVYDTQAQSLRTWGVAGCLHTAT